MIRITDAEDRSQYAALTASGQSAGIGRQRYAAAMYFYSRGMFPPEALEIYRICSLLDRDDPRGLLAASGLLPIIDMIEEDPSCAL